MPFHLESLCGVTLMPHRGCAMDCMGQNEIVRVRNNCGPVLSRLWTKVHEILRQRIGDPSYLPTPLPDCLHRVSFSRYSPLSLEVVEKPNKYKSFLAPDFFSGGTTPTFLQHIVSATIYTVHRLTKCGWVLFADLRQRSLPMKCPFKTTYKAHHWVQ